MLAIRNCIRLSLWGALMLKRTVAALALLLPGIAILGATAPRAAVTCEESIAQCMNTCQDNNRAISLECIRAGGSVTSGGTCSVDKPNCGCIATSPECKIPPPPPKGTERHHSAAKAKSTHAVGEDDPRYLQDYKPKPKQKPAKKTSDDAHGPPPEIPDDKSESSRDKDVTPPM